MQVMVGGDSEGEAEENLEKSVLVRCVRLFSKIDSIKSSHAILITKNKYGCDMY